MNSNLQNSKKLSEKDFNATFITPMNFVGVEEKTSGLDLKLVAESVIESENLKINTKALSIDSIYHNATKTYEHVLINYGIQNKFIVVIIDLNAHIITGYHMLDLNNKD